MAGVPTYVAIFHAVTSVYYFYGLWYDLQYIPLHNNTFGGRLKFLTFLDMLIQTLYFALAIVNDIAGSHTKPSDKGHKKTKLESFLNTLYASLAFPVGVFVVSTFWCIYAVDRELVYPQKLDGIIPAWMNHVMHTTVLPLLLIEKYICFHEYPSKRKGLTILLGFALCYLLWILWVAYYADFWVYPILQVMETHQRIIFITVLMAFFISIYILGHSLNTFLWRHEVAILRLSKAKSQKQNKQNGKSIKSSAKSDKQNGKMEKQNSKVEKHVGKGGKKHKSKAS